MKKILLTLLILFPIVVKADCTTSELSRYKSLASNINTYYEYNEQNNTFNVTLYNFSNELHAVDKTNYITYWPTEQGIGNIYISNVEPGKTITIAIYSNNETCSDERAYTLYINTPYFNKYYNDPICVNNDNKMCSKWVNTTTLSYEDFISKVSIETKIEEKEKETKKEIETSTFIEFIGKYYMIGLILIIIGGGISIYILDKKNKFDFKV